MIGSRERGGILVGWLVKLVLMFAVLGVSLFEAGAVIVARVNVDRVAIDAAREGGLEYGRSGSSAKAERAAASFAAKNGAELLELIVARDRLSVRVKVRKEASTLFIHRIGPLEKFTVAEAQQTGVVH